MHAGRTLLVCLVASCGAAPKTPLSPAQYCAKVSRLASAKDASASMRCDCFTQLYEAMQRDDPTAYACSASCVEESDSMDASAACEKREHCHDHTAPRTVQPQPSNDEQIKAYCQKMVAIDDTSPRLGTSTCTVLASWAKSESPKNFDCMTSCASSAASQADYHACLVGRCR